jgi:hypothetical protein
MARVVSFVLAGTAAASWGYARIFDRGGGTPRVRRLFLGSLVLLGTDIVLKLTLAPEWRMFLRALLGASAGIEAGGSG